MTRAPTSVAARPCRARSSLPPRIDPMLAVAGDLPIDPQNWAFEYKWDGVRCIAYCNGPQVELFSRNQIRITQRYPELADFSRAIGKRGTIFDGEIIALDSNGLPSFARLQNRMHVDFPPPELVRRVPSWLVLFDILYLNGRCLMERPYTQRRELLESVTVAGPCWQLTPYQISEGEAMIKSARISAMEGVVVKQLASPYLPGRRSPTWLKIKTVFGQDLVIGGWIPEVGERTHRVGALLLGYYDKRGGTDKLRYAGRVGTGFNDVTHATLTRALHKLASSTNPFADPVPRTALFVKPTLVAEVQYRRWPADGSIQQASFKGLRDDKSPKDVIRETRGEK